MKTYGFNEISSEKITSLINHAEELLAKCSTKRADSTPSNKSTATCEDKKLLEKVVTTIMNIEMFIGNCNMTHSYTKDKVMLSEILKTIWKTLAKADSLAVTGFFTSYKSLYVYGQYIAELLTNHNDPDTYKVVVLTDRNSKETLPITNFSRGSVSDKDVLNKLVPLTTKTHNAWLAEFVEDKTSKNTAVSVIEVRVIYKKNVTAKFTSNSGNGKPVLKRSTDLRLKTNN